MLTLTDYQKLDRDMIVQAIYDWIFQTDSGFLQKLAVNTVKGNGIKYNIKTERAGVSFQDPEDDIPETTPKIEQRSAAIYLAIKDCYLLKWAKETNATQDPWALQMKSDVEDFVAAINQMLVLGQTTTKGNTKQPKGMLRLIAELESELTTDLDGVNNSQVIANHATSGALGQDKFDELIDAVERPNFLMMSKRARRKLNALIRASGSIVRIEQPELGKFVQFYNEIPIFINTNIPDNLDDNSSSVCNIAAWDAAQARGSGDDNTLIFCGRAMDESGFCINQAIPITQEPVGTHQKKDVEIRRIKWYYGHAAYDKYSLAVLTGVNPDE